LWSEDYWPTLRNVNAESAWQLLEMLMSGEKKRTASLIEKLAGLTPGSSVKFLPR